MIVEAIAKVSAGQDLTTEEATQVMNELMSEDATDAQRAAYLTAMHMKGEKLKEISGSAIGMRSKAIPFKHEGDLLEIVGTGGDKSSSINVSTISSIICAAAGCKVSKHGNRAASSKCGTADCLEAMGVQIAISPEKMEVVLDKTNFAFLFAQVYHPAMKYAGPIRKQIGIPTIFNVLGPLTNPAHANIQLLGVYKEEYVEELAYVLHNIGVEKGMAVHGQDGFDEISLSAPTTVCEFVNGKFTNYEITPEQFGFTRCQKSDIVGGEPAENAQIAIDILSGKLSGPKADVCFFNAGVALHLYKDITIEEGIRMAKEIVASGKAIAKLEEIKAATNA